MKWTDPYQFWSHFYRHPSHNFAPYPLLPRLLWVTFWQQKMSFLDISLHLRQFGRDYCKDQTHQILQTPKYMHLQFATFGIHTWHERTFFADSQCGTRTNGLFKSPTADCLRAQISKRQIQNVVYSRWQYGRTQCICLKGVACAVTLTIPLSTSNSIVFIIHVVIMPQVLIVRGCLCKVEVIVYSKGPFSMIYERPKWTILG